MQWGTVLSYNVEFPTWIPGRSGYAMYLAVKRHSPEQIVIAEQQNSAAIATTTAIPKRPGYQLDDGSTRRPTSANPRIAGSLLLDVGEAEIELATLKIKYWPNIDDPEDYAEITAVAIR